MALPIGRYWYALQRLNDNLALRYWEFSYFEQVFERLQVQKKLEAFGSMSVFNRSWLQLVITNLKLSTFVILWLVLVSTDHALNKKRVQLQSSDFSAAFLKSVEWSKRTCLYPGGKLPRRFKSRVSSPKVRSSLFALRAPESSLFFYPLRSCLRLSLSVCILGLLSVVLMSSRIGASIGFVPF